MSSIINVLSIPFFNTNKASFIRDVLVPRILKREKTFIVTANPEIVEYANEHESYKKIILGADYIIPDGAGIILAAKMLNTPLEERVPGFEITMELLKVANEHHLGVYMLGAAEDVIEAAAAEVNRQYPNIRLHHHHGYIDINDQDLAHEIAGHKPDMIFTALGFPKQEEWISQHSHLFESGVFMGVGGTFDILAGTVKRAPEFWQKLNLEWLYRLIQQPSRWRRMLVLPLFVVKVMLSKKSRA
jgi:N-acetylglucosaminyldiphosphoundecaprenol N-acetyl-beta-D-mannosaminyltransferase